MWFVRFVSAQRTKAKRVNETTFYALIQYFAIILFECKECEDFLPAKHIMSLCFTFYHEVEVPGCDPYREYLFNYLRDQPIWHSLRFWNAALFYALQKDKVPKSSTTTPPLQRKHTMSSSKTFEDGKDALNTSCKSQQPSRSISESSLSSSSSSTDTTRSSIGSDSLKRIKNARKINRSSKGSTIVDGGGGAVGEDNTFDVDQKKLQDNTNVAFSQLG